MLKNFFKTALRSLFRHKGYSLINILGLAVGMAAGLLIFMYVRHELSYDDYHVDADRIYRVSGSYHWGGRDFDIAVAPPPQARAMVDDFPEVEEAVRFRQEGSFVVQKDKVAFRERRISYADASFFSMFTVPLLAGDPDTALAAPHTLVLSRKTAEKYFRDQNPIGEVLRLDNRDDYKVTGVFEEIPDNSHFHFDILLSMASLEESRNPSWTNQNFQTYIRLRPGADPAALEAKFPAMMEKYLGPELEKLMGRRFSEMTAQGDLSAFNYLQPLRSIHLHSDLVAEIEANGDIRYVYIFSAIAFFILVIAAINFMNLSTARSSSRAKEVGLRKVLGSFRRQLVFQFLAESLLLSCIAMAAALVLVLLLLPLFNQLAGKQLPVDYLWSGMMPAWIGLITLTTGLLAGIYPAFFIASFRPSGVIRGQMKSGKKAGLLRNGLVVLQFVSSVILIVGTLVVTRQLHFIRNKNLGFDKQRVVILDNAYLLGNQARAFKEAMLARPEIVSASISGYLPVPSNRNNNSVLPDGDIMDEHATSFQNWVVDYDYLKTMGMTLVEGRDFSREYSTDAGAACIINQAAARHFEWARPLEHRVGKFINREGECRLYQVIGVVGDFHYESLRDNITPLVMFLGEDRGRICFRIAGSDLAAAVESLRRTWQRFLPGQPFEYSFMDEKFEAVYRSEQRVGRIFGVFSALALSIGCLGLFGLATFAAAQRTREIGIRKVLGASVPSVVFLMMREFLLLVLIANLIAWPVAFLAMRRWLADFAYRISLGTGVFFLAGGAALLIALLTVSSQAIKASLADPSRSLRYE